MRLKNSYRLELVRIFVINGINAPLLFILSEGAFQNFWPGYLIMCLASGTFLTYWNQTRTLSYLQLVFWTANLWLANYLLHPTGLLQVEGLLVVSGILVLSSTLLIEVTRLLIYNINQIVSAREQIYHSAKLSTLGEMAGGIAHEINTPLATIHLLSEQLKDMLSEDQSLDRNLLMESANSLILTSQKISHIIDGMRSFARDASQDPVERVLVKNLVDDTLSLCGSRIRAKGVRLRVPAIDSTVTFEGRRSEVSQVLLNLLNNALDAALSSSEKHIEILVRSHETFVEIAIIDSGPRMSETVRGKLFQPFFTTKEIGQGTGLGLSASLGIIEAHGGEIYLDESYKQTKFIVRLPKVFHNLHQEAV